MTWEPVVIIIGAAVLAGQQAVNFVVVRAVVRAEVSKLNGTYRRKELCEERHEHVDHRLMQLEAER